MTTGRFAHERMWNRETARDRSELWTARSPYGVVASAHYAATEAGVTALEAGGNAVDAAVAVSLALGVCESAGSGLGGMSQMLVYLRAENRTFVIEGPCRAPHAATPEAVSRSADRYHGYRAVAVPTLVAVLRHAIETYGRLGRADVLAPAIRLAEDGFAITSLHRRMVVDYGETLRRGNAGELFLDASGQPPAVGHVLRQPALARTLRRLESAGFEDFYHGEIARRIAEDVEANGGFVRRRDLSRTDLVRETEPLTGRYRGHAVGTVGPPAGGLTLLQMLQMASCVDPASLDLDTPEGACLVAGIIRRARTDRRRVRLRTGPDGVGEAAELLDPEYAKRALRGVLARLDSRPAPSGAVAGMGGSGEAGETSHLCVMDAEGNVVASTQSIERSFGAAVCTPSLGFLYNGYLRVFKIRNRKHPHFLRRHAPARSNAAPTLLFRGRLPHAAIGNTGSERMQSGIFEVLLRLERQTAFEAVSGPRLHCTPEGLVQWEEDRFPAGVSEALRARGFELEKLEPYSFKAGGLQLAVRERDGMCAVADPRRDGAAGARLPPPESPRNERQVAKSRSRKGASSSGTR